MMAHEGVGGDDGGRVWSQEEEEPIGKRLLLADSLGGKSVEEEE